MLIRLLTTMNRSKYLKRLMTAFCLAAPALTAYGQLTDEILKDRFNQAVLDSAVRYELLKPLTANLQKQSLHLQKENHALSMQVQIMSFRLSTLQNIFAQQLTAERRKRRLIILIGASAVTSILLIR
ncbi:hypothetical protein DYBT9275_00923 [Dyadobacter sp. CECT 9275]|uniref:Uncharacterized protein n=2 Tax=Dyadobacter helix TaxID=2822344 RepID=A0A916NB67_9BACT|nr:hypothetical protein DYBT9275_00923 [Dyadobacter sp. CECT 9275]